MLSIVDLKREIGKNIYIYPLHTESIKSNSIDLHVSRFAWSITTKKPTVEGEYVVIKPRDTALIYTEESIFVSHKIGGAYNSKVTIVSQGGGHIGTTLDAQYIGCSLVAVNNHSEQPLRLKIGSEFVTLHFWYLSSPAYENIPSHDNEPGHPRMLNGYEETEEYIEWRNSNPWTTRNIELLHAMENSDEYKQLKKDYANELERYKRNRTKKYIAIIGVSLAVVIILCLVAYVLPWGDVSTAVRNISERFLFPIIVSLCTTFVVVDISKRKIQ